MDEESQHIPSKSEDNNLQNIPSHLEEQSDWSLSSVEPIPISSLVEEDQLDDGNVSKTMNNDQCSYVSKYPAPEKPKLKKEAGFNKIGKIHTFVGEVMIVIATDTMILDLDNYVFDKQRRLLGYVVDVFGPITRPFYSIKLEDTQIISTLQIDQPIYFCQGSRLLNKQDIQTLKKKGKQDFIEVFDQSSDEVDSEEQKQKNIQKSKRPHGGRNQIRQQQKLEKQPFKRQQREPQQQVHYNNQQQAQMMMPPNLTPQQQQLFMQNMYREYYNQMMYFYTNKK